jgi:phosphate transport system permease protein
LPEFIVRLRSSLAADTRQKYLHGRNFGLEGQMSVATAGPNAPARQDTPRKLDRGLLVSEHLFNWSARAVGALVLIITGSIGLFLFLQLIPTLHAYGLSFFTQVNWLPDINKVGVAAALLGSFEVAAVAITVSVPLALLTALYISEYAPRRLRGPLVTLVDLMAAVPSIVYGIWGFFLLEPHAAEVTRWLSTYMGWFPPFHVSTDTHAAVVLIGPRYYGSTAIAGLVASMMVVPIACAVMRGVFAQAPLGEREGALALGATRWGMIRAVVIPFGRGGIIGGTMLGLGRALGETIAVFLIISPLYAINFHILQTGSITISSLIAARFGESTPQQLSALLAAGFVLFSITLVVNMIAAVFITRSRSGAATEI